MKNIKGFENYLVSESGTIINSKTGRNLKNSLNTNGYEIVQISQNGYSKNLTIHRIVYAAYVGDITDGFEVNHIDGNKRNNHFTNLELTTHKENMYKAVLTGNIKSGEDSWNSRVVLKKHVITGEILSEYGSIRLATKDTGVSGPCISNCINGKRITAGGFKWEAK